MKTLFNIAIVLFFSVQLAYGQYTKGDKEIIGSLGGYIRTSSNASYDVRNISIDVDSRLGWFVKDNVALGILLDVGYSHHLCTGTKYDKTKDLNWSIGGYARWYVGDKRFKPFIESNLYFNRRTYNRWDEDASGELVHEDSEKYSTVVHDVRWGVQYRVNDWFSLEGRFPSFLTTTIYNKANDGENTPQSISFSPQVTLSASSVSLGARFKI